MTTTHVTPPAITENAVFPTPWTYEIELHSDDTQMSRVYIYDLHHGEIASYDGYCEGAHQFIESAHAMEESHKLLEACKWVLWYVNNQAAMPLEMGESLREAVEPAIADAERP